MCYNTNVRGLLKRFRMENHMKLSYQLKKGKTYPLGVCLNDQGIHIAVPMKCKESCGIIIYLNQSTVKIPFPKEMSVGNLYTVDILGISVAECSYQLFSDEEVFVDDYCKSIIGKEKWGSYPVDRKVYRGYLKSFTYDWEDDRNPMILFSDSIFYHAHVRGFTKHSSSKIKEKGTFAGVVRKIDYLKELGITGICLMPFYEFDEIIVNPNFKKIDDSIAQFMDDKKQTWEYKINYWGFSKEAFYFAPKKAYSYTKEPVKECKDMIKALHKAGIEVLMQVYFPKGMKADFIYRVIEFWATEYHVDGFFIQGNEIPQKLIKDNPILANTKLIFEKYMEDEEGKFSDTDFKNCGFINDAFMYDSRKFLKGDGDMLSKMALHLRNNPMDGAAINQMTSYNSFTLMDLLSYNRKHNEENGEDNHDGNDYNYSWNCGFEGPTKRKSVLELRNRQYRNAILIMMSGQATPMILAGDEFGNSHLGNNNAYCLDNSVNWLNWKELDKNRALFEYVKFMIAFRKMHPILHQPDALKIMDYIGCGYPDLSYHGEMAWYGDFANYNHHMGILYCGKYARKARNTEDDFIYILYNMYWEENTFALPKLPEKLKWGIVVDTDCSEQISVDQLEVTKEIDNTHEITLKPRSIRILRSVKDNSTDGKKVKK